MPEIFINLRKARMLIVGKHTLLLLNFWDLLLYSYCKIRIVLAQIKISNFWQSIFVSTFTKPKDVWVVCHMTVSRSSRWMYRAKRNAEGCWKVNSVEKWRQGARRRWGEHPGRNLSFTAGHSERLSSIFVLVCICLFAKVTYSIPRRKSFLREGLLHTVNDILSA